MSKYIIEIPDDVPFVLLRKKARGEFITKVVPVAELEELNSDYINEHYGELQDTAYKKGLHDGESKCRYCNDYQRGLEDGKKSIDLGCKDCKYHEDTSLTNPCSECTRARKDHYTPAPHSDRIEVGDEVVWKTDNITLIATSIYKVGSIKWCDGVAKDGKVYSTLIENDRKTGKHYDIASILEAMRTHD